MNHKQEVIEILTKTALAFDHCGCDECQASAKRQAENDYDRIAPLMQREFPMEKATLVVKDLLNNLCKIWEGQPAKAVSGTITGRAGVKDTWEPPDVAVREGDNILEQDKPEQGIEGGLWVLTGAANDNFPEQDKPKITCQTCGGDKPLPLKNVSQHVYTDHLPCPDCGGTGEDRRSGEERRENIAVKIAYHGERLYGRRIPDGLVADSDRRTLLDRRKAGSG